MYNKNNDFPNLNTVRETNAMNQVEVPQSEIQVEFRMLSQSNDELCKLFGILESRINPILNDKNNIKGADLDAVRPEKIINSPIGSMIMSERIKIDYLIINIKTILDKIAL